MLWSKEDESILVLDDSTQIFEVEDYTLCLEDSGSEKNAKVGFYNCILDNLEICW